MFILFSDLHKLKHFHGLLKVFWVLGAVPTGPNGEIGHWPIS
jgi:hypothetical protein